MKKIEELEKIEGNGKVILLNTDNGHWARMSKEWYNRSIQTVEEKEKFGQMLEERFGLLGEGVEKSHSIVLNDLLKNWVKSADEPFLFRVIFRYFD